MEGVELYFNDLLTIDILLYYRDKDWDWKEVSKRIALSDILNHPELPWDYPNIEYFRFSDVKDHLHLPWNMSKCLNIPLDYVLKNLDVKWDWCELSRDYNINEILKHDQLPWDHQVLSTRNDVTISVVLRNPHVPWDYDVMIRYNNNMTIQTVAENKGTQVPFETLLIKNLGSL
jgi:hypothetical protein